MKVFYYYYYLFYTKVIVDSEPHATVVFTLSLTISLLINGLLNILLSYKLAYNLSTWQMIGLFLLITFFIYLKYYRIRERIVAEKPMFLNSNFVSILMTTILFLTAMFSLFFGPDIAKQLVEK